MTDAMDEYHALYVQEARQHLGLLRASFEALAADPTNRQALEDARFAAHSLKGISLTMNYEQPASLAKEMESCLSLMLQGGLPFDGETLAGALDQLEASVNALSA